MEITYVLSVLWFNLAVSNWDQTAAHSPLLFLPTGWGREWAKRETHGLIQFNKVTKQILLLIVKGNMQNKLYAVQFFSPPGDQLRSQPPSSDRGTCGFPGAHGFHHTREFCKTGQKNPKNLNSWKSSN